MEGKEIMKKYLAICLLFTACNPNTMSNSTEVTEAVSYVKDVRSNLCFARMNYWDGEGYDVNVVCVPCDSVKHLLK